MLKLGVHKTFKGKKLYTEVWKDVKGYEGLYQVSNMGRVKSLDRLVKHPKSKDIYRKINEKILVAAIEKKGYVRVCLNKEGKHKVVRIHRLVAEAFLPNIENKATVDHINTIKTDNRVQNLRWATQKENCNNELTKKQVSEEPKEKRFPKEVKEKMRKNSPNNKKVLCIETGLIYISANEAGRQTGIQPNNIRGVCKGVKKSAGGYHWKYVKSN